MSECSVLVPALLSYWGVCHPHEGPGLSLQFPAEPWLPQALGVRQPIVDLLSVHLSNKEKLLCGDPDTGSVCCSLQSR